MINLKPYLAYIRSTLRLTMRDRVVLFFSYFFPLLFFIAFGEGFGAAQGTGAAAQVVTMVLVLGVLGNGFFGGGMRATLEREMGILRRFKVAPITAAPILVASIITGWAIFMPAAILFLAIAKFRYHMPLPENLMSLAVMLSLGAVAFRSMGLIIASVANSMAESQIIIQLLYFPMLLLSGATIPLTTLSEWLQVVAQFLPATHLYLGMQGIIMRNDTLLDHWTAIGALALATFVCLFISVKLFRWEKDDMIKPAAKLWVAVALLPFLLLGGWQAWTRTNLQKTKIIARQQRRSMSWLVRDARIFTGDGQVIDTGSVLIRDGKIAELYRGLAPDAKALRAEPMEASGRTLLPGLVDLMVILPQAGEAEQAKALAQLLYCGVTGARAASPNPAALAGLVSKLRSGELLAAQILAAAPFSPTPPMPQVAAEWTSELAGGAVPSLLSRSLTQQVLKPAEMAALKQKLTLLHVVAADPKTEALPMSLSGWNGMPYGPALHRQLQLMVRSGMAPADALRAATSGAASRAGQADLGFIRRGAEADLLLVDGNPLEDISATERIVAVFLKGERVIRSDLIEGGE